MKRRVRDWQLNNPERHAAKQAEWRDSGRKAASNRRSHLRTTFELSEEQYQEKVEAQYGRCAICNSLPKEGVNLDFDHDHCSGAVRGLLCRNCNHGLGKFFDDPLVMASALLYLFSWEDPARETRVRVMVS